MKFTRILAALLSWFTTSGAVAGGGAPSPAGPEPAYFIADLVAERGPAPFTVAVTGRASSGEPCFPVCYACASLEVSDGATEMQCDGQGGQEKAELEFSFNHVLVCPGTYTVRAHAYDAPHDCTDPRFCREWTVTVDPPSYQVIPGFALDGWSCRFVSVGNVGVAHITASTIDWGDGSAIQAFSWQATAGTHESPSHRYNTTGTFDVRITNLYTGSGCEWEEVRLTTVHIPGTTTATEETTWGRVKSIYRR